MACRNSVSATIRKRTSTTGNKRSRISTSAVLCAPSKWFDPLSAGSNLPCAPATSFPVLAFNGSIVLSSLPAFPTDLAMKGALTWAIIISKQVWNISAKPCKLERPPNFHEILLWNKASPIHAYDASCEPHNMLTRVTHLSAQYALESQPILLIHWTCGVFTCHKERLWFHGNRER